MNEKKFDGFEPYFDWQKAIKMAELCKRANGWRCALLRFPVLWVLSKINADNLRRFGASQNHLCQGVFADGALMLRYL